VCARLLIALFARRPSPLLLTFHSFSFTHPPTTKFYTLSLHDALPILEQAAAHRIFTNHVRVARRSLRDAIHDQSRRDRRATRTRSEEHRLNSSHVAISYAVFCLKKKKKR